MNKKWFTLFILLYIFVSCNTTKNIPQGEYLLNTVKLEQDSKNTNSVLEPFIQQQPNQSFPLVGKAMLKIYNLANTDSKNFINRMIRKIGTPPVIYDEHLAKNSMVQLKKELYNQGYLLVKIDTTVIRKNKKINIIYKIKSGIPYRIRNYKNTIEDPNINKILNNIHQHKIIDKGDFFDLTNIENERERINTILRNEGYYGFSKNYIYFKADTTLNSHQVDLFLNIRTPKNNLPYTRYKIHKVTVISGINPSEFPPGSLQKQYIKYFFKHTNTTKYRDITILRGYNKFLKNSTIYRNNYLHKGDYFSDNAITKTYEAYNKMHATKQVSVTMHPNRKDSLHKLNAYVILYPSDPHWVKLGFEGTNAAGDIGLSPSITYQHQNIFNGSEQLNAKIKGAYEFIVGNGGNAAYQKTDNLLNHSYYEIGGEIGLSFPRFLLPWLKEKWKQTPTSITQFVFGVTTQHRPEYSRQFFNLTANYRWSSNKGLVNHSLALLDINYVNMPWVSSLFKEVYLDDTKNPMLRESYKNQLIERTSYSIVLTDGKHLSLTHPTYTIRINGEIAGIIPHLITTLGGAKKELDGSKSLFNVSYAEYAKGNIDYTRTFHFSPKRSFVYHLGFGIGCPYGNSTVMPFERRFFAGGPNSIRGWNTRTLGPGSYVAQSGISDFVNQTGDIRFEANFETRHKLTKLLELAGFLDAGNIWTLKDYPSQPGGQFKFNSFYKEIAMAYGLGIRFDLGFILLRVDTGIRIYDPGLPLSHRFVMFKPNFSRMAWHFGIGYPF